MRVVFAGTPEVALPALDAIAGSEHELVGVVTRPDAPSGRGRRLTESPVAARAAELGVPVLKPDHPRDPEFQAALRDLAPDCCPVVAYGALIPRSALDIPLHGWVNLHFSLLPAWRGAAPVQHSIWAGDEITGATTFRIVAGARRRADLRADDRDRSSDRHGRRPAGATGRGRSGAAGRDPRRDRRRLPGGARPARRGRLPRAQDHRRRRPRSSGARRPSRSTAGSGPARRGPAPGPRSTTSGSSSARWRRSPTAPSSRPGVLSVGKSEVLVGTGTLPVRLGDVKAFGKKQMPAADWARGARLADGAKFA